MSRDWRDLHLLKPLIKVKGFLNSLISFFRDLFQYRYLIWVLAKRDFKARYLGSYLGIFWAFVHPILIMLIMWFVFEVGFKARPVENFPFFLWLISGLIPWFFISSSMTTGANSIIEKSYLVKKVTFRVSILPIIKILSNLFIHIPFLFLMLLIYALHGYLPDLYSLQLIYYLACGVAFLLGFSWLTYALAVFVRDVSQFVSIFVQFLFWLTPIVWNIDRVPQSYRFILKLNPIYYVIQGYRNSMVYKVWFWQDMRLTLYFWTFTLLLLIVSSLVFRRLRPHFADVL